jgi:hypothetical protein
MEPCSRLAILEGEQMLSQRAGLASMGHPEKLTKTLVFAQLGFTQK